MDAQPNMLDFVKAMSNADRLKIVGMLTKSPATAAQVAAELHVPFRDAFEHLSFLRFVGVVRTNTGDQSQEAVYALNPEGAEKLAQARLAGQRESYVPAPHLDEKARKVLVACLNADGSIRQLPSIQSGKLKYILEYLVEAFTPGMDYKEKEVNSIIRRFHEDVSGLRRDLIDAGLLQRESDGSRYWRPDPAAEQRA